VSFLQLAGLGVIEYRVTDTEEPVSYLDAEEWSRSGSMAAESCN
jgi:hypothetical protein